MRLLREFGSVVKYFGPVFQRSNNKCCGHCTDLHPMHHQRALLFWRRDGEPKTSMRILLVSFYVTMQSVFAVQSIWTAHKARCFLTKCPSKSHMIKVQIFWEGRKFVWCHFMRVFFCILGKNNNNPNRWMKSNYKKAGSSDEVIKTDCVSINAIYC